MPVEPLVDLTDHFAVDRRPLPPDLSPATRSTASRAGSKSKAALHSPSAAPNRVTFMLVCRDPFSISACGRLSARRGPSRLVAHCRVRSSITAIGQ